MLVAIQQRLPLRKPAFASLHASVALPRLRQHKHHAVAQCQQPLLPTGSLHCSETATQCIAGCPTACFALADLKRFCVSESSWTLAI